MELHLESSTPKIVGRRAELDHLSRISASGTPAIIVVYGRRRVGKTTIISMPTGTVIFLKSKVSRAEAKLHKSKPLC